MNVFPIFINMNKELNDFIISKLGLGYIFLTFFDVEHKKEATIVTSFYSKDGLVFTFVFLNDFFLD